MDQRGFSLVSVMTSVAIFSVVALAMGQLIIEQQRATAFLQDSFQKIQLSRTIDSLLRNPAACGQSIAGQILLNSGVSTVLHLKDQGGTPLFTSNRLIENLKIGQIYIENETVPGPSSSGFVKLFVPIERTRKGGGPSQLTPFQIRLPVQVNARRRIVQCGPQGLIDSGEYVLTGNIGESSKVLSIPGIHDFCSFSGFKTTADDSNIYDGCMVSQMTTPGQWQIQVNKHPEDTLVCRARCFSVNF